MSATVSPERIVEIFTVPINGVIGLVDRLIEVARGRALRLEWRDDRVWAHLPGAAAVPVVFRKTVFRAALGRVFVLCDDYKFGSVSPYGGMGRLSAGDPPTDFRVAFTNTPDEQTLELIDEQALQRFLTSSPLNGAAQSVS